jgi:thymidylate kinase
MCRTVFGSGVQGVNTMVVSVRDDRPATISPLLVAVFEQFDQARIIYCLLRGHEEVLTGAIDGDVDLLVAAKQFSQMRSELERLGFVALARWGQSPHHFCIGYDESNDLWIKLDIMTQLAYGRPIPALRTDLAADCLSKRVRSGVAFVLPAAEEFLTLLLHCLLDKGLIEPGYQARLANLACQIGDDWAMAALVGRCFPAAVSWAQIKQAIVRADWPALLTLRAAAAAHLARADRVGTRWRRAITPVLRFLDRRTRSLRTPGLTVALLAPDGAGKTTLARSLAQAFYLPTRYIYMGSNLNSGSVMLPTTRLLARTPGKRGRVVRALSALNSLAEQGLRYRVGAYHRLRGRLVVFDRYAAGSLMAVQQDGALHKRLRRWAMQLLCPPPDMVVYLDAPAEVLYQRKQEHSPELLDRQRQRYLQILDGVAQTAFVDAGREPEQVRRQVAGLIWRRYAVDMQKK